MSERERRIGKNEGLFREVNERIEEVNEAFSFVTGDMTLVCECGRESCMAELRTSFAEYERVRSDPMLFFVIPGHEEPDVETVVEDHAEYVVVRKREGVPARLAEETDPRRRHG